jgi:hypothetical protein
MKETVRFRLNVMVEWLALLRIREVPGSNLSLETGYPDRFFVVFLGPCRRMPELP